MRNSITISAGRAFFLWTAEPAQRGPSLKPGLYFQGPFFRRNLASAKGRPYGRGKRFSLAQCCQNGKFFLFEPAEINGVIYAVNGKKNLRRLEFRNSADALAFAMLRECVAGKIRVVVFLADFKEQIIDGIAKTQHPHIRLKNQLQSRA